MATKTMASAGKARKALEAASRAGRAVDWLTVAFSLAGSKADGSVDCSAAGTWLHVSAATIRRWLRQGPGLAAAERIAHAAGIPRVLIAPEFGKPF